MKYLLILTIGVCLLFSSVPAMADQAEDEAAIRKANEQRLAAWNARDTKAYLALIDEDCTAGFVGEPCVSPLRKGGTIELPKNFRSMVVEEGGVVFVTPDVAIYRYTVERSGLLDADGKLIPTEKVRNARVFVKKGGKWLQAAQLSQTIEESPTTTQ